MRNAFFKTFHRRKNEKSGTGEGSFTAVSYTHLDVYKRQDGQIWQQPVREIAQYHKNPCHYEHAEIDGETALSGICGRTMDLTVTMDEQDFNVFSIQLAADEEYETSFTYHKGTGILEIDRTYCGCLLYTS